METTSLNGTLVGGVLDFPVTETKNRPTPASAIKEQINVVASLQTIVPIIGNFAGQVTGNFVNGINITQPGTRLAVTGPLPPSQAQVGFTGIIGEGPLTLPGPGDPAFSYTGTLGG